MPFSALPIELLDPIVYQVDDPKDLGSLRLVCRYLGWLADKQFWNRCTLKLDYSNISMFSEILAEDQSLSCKVRRLNLDNITIRQDLMDRFNLMGGLVYLQINTPFPPCVRQNPPEFFKSLQEFRFKGAMTLNDVRWCLPEMPNLRSLAILKIEALDQYDPEETKPLEPNGIKTLEIRADASYGPMSDALELLQSPRQLESLTFKNTGFRGEELSEIIFSLANYHDSLIKLELYDISGFQSIVHPEFGLMFFQFGKLQELSLSFDDLQNFAEVNSELPVSLPQSLRILRLDFTCNPVRWAGAIQCFHSIIEKAHVGLEELRILDPELTVQDQMLLQEAVGRGVTLIRYCLKMAKFEMVELIVDLRGRSLA